MKSDSISVTQDGKTSILTGVVSIFYQGGAQNWYLNGKLHRTDGPALIEPYGEWYDKEWYFNGKLHRGKDENGEIGPAIEFYDGTQLWYRHGFLHRIDGPASVDSNGEKMWYLNGDLHRDDGPAIVYPDGKEEWYQNGLHHRENGPAVVYPDGKEEWYLYEGLTSIQISNDDIVTMNTSAKS